jgi:hypothetical protein
MNTGHNEKGSLMMRLHPQTPDKSAFCFLKRFAVKPGKTYNARVFVKTKDMSDNTKISISFQGLNAAGGFLGLPVQTASLTAPLATEWQELNLTFAIPAIGDWAQTRNLLLTMGPENTKTGTIWFDDFELSEQE